MTDPHVHIDERLVDVVEGVLGSDASDEAQLAALTSAVAINQAWSLERIADAKEAARHELRVEGEKAYCPCGWAVSIRSNKFHLGPTGNELTVAYRAHLKYES